MIASFLLLLGPKYRPTVSKTMIDDTIYAHLVLPPKHTERTAHAADKHLIPKKHVVSHKLDNLIRETKKLHSSPLAERVSPIHHPVNQKSKLKEEKSADKTLHPHVINEVLRFSYPQPKIGRPPPKILRRPVNFVNLTIPYNPHSNPHIRHNPQPKRPPPMANKNLKSDWKYTPDPHEIGSSDELTAKLKPIAPAVTYPSPLLDRPLAKLAEDRLLQGLNPEEKFKAKFFNEMKNSRPDEDCRKRYCAPKPKVKPPSNSQRLPYKPTPSRAFNLNIASMYPKPHQTSLHARPSPRQGAIDARHILNNFPELRKNGITEAVLNKLAARIPNLEERIYAHFAMKNNSPKRLMQNPQIHDMSRAEMAFLKNYQSVENSHHGFGAPGDHPSTLLPSQTKILEQENQHNFMANIDPVAEQQNEMRIKQESQRMRPNFPPLMNPEPSKPAFVPHPPYAFEVAKFSGETPGGPLQNELYEPPKPFSVPQAPPTQPFELPASFTGAQSPPQQQLPPQESPPQYIRPTEDLMRRVEAVRAEQLQQEEQKQFEQLYATPKPEPFYQEASINDVEEPQRDNSERACTRDGNCPSTEGEPQNIEAANPEVDTNQPTMSFAPPSQDQTTQGSEGVGEVPDARYADYYNNYMAGKVPTDSMVSQSNTPAPTGTAIAPSYEWTPFSFCSATCGRGQKKRFRRCMQQDCPSGGVEIESVPCADEECAGKK